MKPILDTPILKLYERKDKELPPEEPRVVFTGSSIIQYWRALEKDIAPFPVLNRGIAGAKISEIRSGVERLALKHKPLAIVLYAGSNDLRGENPPKANYILEEFRQYAKQVKDRNRHTRLIFLSIAPSAPPFKEKYPDRIHEANARVEEYCSSTEGLFYHDLWTVLTDHSQNTIPEYYRKDGIHFTGKGYKAIAPGIAKILEAIL